MFMVYYDNLYIEVRIGNLFLERNRSQVNTVDVTLCAMRSR